MSRDNIVSRSVAEPSTRKRRVMVGAIGACVHNLGVAPELEWSDFLVERIRQVRERENRPIIRAHIGIAAETIDPTVEAIEKLADAGALEIVSLAPDQPSQEMLAKFIRGEEDPDKYLRGQGGAPIRTIEDLKRLKAATQRGNFPMTRIYTGTDELVSLANLYEKYLNMCFPAVPIFSAPRTGDGNLVLADASGNLAAFEVGHRACGIVEAPAGWVAATNHFVTPEMEAYYVPEGQRHLRGSSRRRRAVVEEALHAARGQIDVVWARQLMARHGGPLDALCRHKNLERGRVTISTSIFLPADRQLLFCHGQPCQAEYHRISVAD